MRFEVPTSVGKNFVVRCLYGGRTYLLGEDEGVSAECFAPGRPPLPIRYCHLVPGQELVLRVECVSEDPSAFFGTFWAGMLPEGSWT